MKGKSTKTVIESRLDIIINDLMNFKEKSEREYSRLFNVSKRQVRRYRKQAYAKINRYKTVDTGILKAKLNELLLNELSDDNFLTRPTPEQRFKIIDRLMKLNRLGEAPEPGE